MELVVAAPKSGDFGFRDFLSRDLSIEHIIPEIVPTGK